MRKDVLAAGARKADFYTGGTGDVELKNVSTEPRNKDIEVIKRSNPKVKPPQPLYDRILVRRREAEDVTPGGILIPDTGKDLPCRGEVMSVGCGYVTDTGIRPMIVKEGDKILFGKYSGTEVELAGEKILIMREEEILAIE